MKTRKVLSFVKKQTKNALWRVVIVALYVCFIEKLIMLDLNEICDGVKASIVIDLLWKSCKPYKSQEGVHFLFW